MKTLVALMALFSVSYAAAFADIIYLNDGTSFEGRVVGFNNNEVTIETEESTFTINRFDIKKVKRDKEEDEKIDEEKPIGPSVPRWDSNWE